MNPQHTTSAVASPPAVDNQASRDHLPTGAPQDTAHIGDQAGTTLETTATNAP